MHKGRVPVIAGEVKVIGSLPHRIGNRIYPERNINIDINKRVKEVKYTPVDLKRKYDPVVSKPWIRWIEETRPKFYTFWLLRLGSSNRLYHILEKIRGIKEYNNGGSTIVYKEDVNSYKYIFTGDNIVQEAGKLTSNIADEIYSFLIKASK